MLDGLRNFAKTVPGKVLGAILLVGVAGFGINNVILDFGNNTIARVGDQEITVRAFQRAYSNEINRFAMQFGTVPTGSEAVSMGLPATVIQRLAQDAALDGLASQFGLGVTEDKLGRMVREDPSFSGTLGAFNAETFQQVLRSAGLTEAEYFSMQTRAANREQLVVSLFGDAEIPDTAARLLGRYVGDQRTLEYFVVNETGIETPPEPSETELQAFLEDNQTAFRTVETRVVDVVSLSLQSLAEGMTIPEAEIAEEYERTRESLTTPERRAIEQVALPSEDLVIRFEQGLAAGESFDALVEEAGLTLTVLGTRAQAEISDANLARAAFGLEGPGDFAVIAGIGGRRAVHVRSIEPQGVPTIEEARAVIEERLSLAAARSDYMIVLDQVEELRASFQPLPAIAERFGLDIERLAVTADGSALAAITDLPAEGRTRLTQAIFSADPERLTAPLALASTHNVFFDLVEVEPVRNLTLAEARDEVLAGWYRERTASAVAEQADAALVRLAQGEALADIAIGFNQFPQISSPFDRSGEFGTAIDEAVADAAFAGGPGHVGTALNQSGERVVFEVIDVAVAENGLDDNIRLSLASDTQIALFGDFVAGVRDTAGLRINQQALEQFLTANSGQ